MYIMTPSTKINSNKIFDITMTGGNNPKIGITIFRYEITCNEKHFYGSAERDDVYC